jgi:hypothetical protein
MKKNCVLLKLTSKILGEIHLMIQRKCSYKMRQSRAQIVSVICRVNEENWQIFDYLIVGNKDQAIHIY